MALDQFALLELLERLQGTDVSERIRTASQTIYQALIDAELASVIGGRALGTDRTPLGVSERFASPDAFHHGRRPGACSAQAAVRIVLPKPARAPPPR